MEERFKRFKKEILRRAKKAKACKDAYKEAYKAETFDELIRVIEDNLLFAVEEKILEEGIISAYREELRASKIYCNENADDGIVFVTREHEVYVGGTAVVFAYDNAKVSARDYATVKAFDFVNVTADYRTTVTARDNVSVTASGKAVVTLFGTSKAYTYGNVIVYAWGDTVTEARQNTYVEADERAGVYAFDFAVVKAWGNSNVKAFRCATVTALDNATVEACDNSIVLAHNNVKVTADEYAYVQSPEKIECTLRGKAVYRCTLSNMVRFNKDEITIKTEENHGSEDQIVRGEDNDPQRS